MEAVTIGSHQDNGYVRTPAHTNLKQGAVLSLGLIDQASRVFYFYSLRGSFNTLTKP